MERFNADQNSAETLEKKGTGAEQLSRSVMEIAMSEEGNVLKPLIHEARGKNERESSEWQAKRWKEAVLCALTFMAVSGIGAEARAQNKAMLDADGWVQVETTAETDPKQIAANKKKVEKLRHELESSRLKKKAAYLRERYGPCVDNILAEIGINEANFKNLAIASRGGDDRQIYFETMIAGNYDYLWNKQEILKTAAKRSRMPKIEGFEVLPKLDNEKVRLILETFPSELVSNADKVEYIPEVPKEYRPMVYEAIADTTNVGVYGTILHEKNNVVAMYKFDLIEDEEALRSVFAHEIMHINSPESSNRLTIPERVEMLSEITELFLDPKREKSTYIDEYIPKDFKIKNMSEEETKYRQANEFWAVTFQSHRDAFTAEGYTTLQRQMRSGVFVPKDLRLLEKWIDKMEIPAFKKIKQDVLIERSRPSQEKKK